jgi:protein-tyrosine phosphatase
MTSQPTKVLFVCLGNICRSPLAESIFRQQAAERGVANEFEVDSAGTSGYHVGAPPDARSVATALGRGVPVKGASRQLRREDLERFEYIIVMDTENFEAVERIRRAMGSEVRVHRLREWDPEGGALDVPDPYYGGSDGFERVHDLVERSCEALLDHLLSQRVRA